MTANRETLRWAAGQAVLRNVDLASRWRDLQAEALQLAVPDELVTLAGGRSINNALW
jgi:hypothetical protein